MIDRGHNYNDILYKYPFELFVRFNEAASKNLLEEHKINKLNIIEIIEGCRWAYHAKDKDFKQYIKNYMNILKDNKPKIATKQEVERFKKQCRQTKK